MGGTAEPRVDVRVLAATNRDVTAMVRQGLLREDLFYRLSTIHIEIPPLRNRVADIELLARHSWASSTTGSVAPDGWTTGRFRCGRRHSWPGNVRELLHAIEAAMVICDDDRILPGHLPATVRDAGALSAPLPSVLPTLEELERKHIKLALDAAGGHRGRAAASLGISERNLYRKLHDYNLLQGPKSEN